jgi:hypothetical protein
VLGVIAYHIAILTAAESACHTATMAYVDGTRLFRHR